MPTLQSILAEVSALANSEESAFEAALSQCVADLNTLISAQPTAPAAPTATSVAITFSDGSTQVLPQS